MTPRGGFLLQILLVCATLFAADTANAQSVPGRADLSRGIDESARVVLKGNRHPLAIPANDRGEVAPDLPMERMLLVLRPSPDQDIRVQQLLAQQQDRNSPNFHAWLTPEQFARQFAPAKANQEAAAAWLQTHGFRITRFARGGMLIEFAGAARQVKEAFSAPIHQYSVNGKTHYANAEDPQIPSALASTIAGVSTLHNFEKHSAIRVLGTANRVANTSTWQPDFTFKGFFGVAHYLAPGDFATIYNTASLYKNGIDGTGQSIAIVARSNINRSDFQIYRLAFGLPANDPVIVLDGPDPGNSFGADESEADLDVEWAGAIAPKATIKLVVSGTTNTTDGVDLSAQYIIDNNIAPILSTSFGQCESQMGQAETTLYKNLWQQAAAEGITVVVSSGDSGPAGCDSAYSGPAMQGAAVNGIASTPFNIAVGGTQFDENGADSKYWATTNGADQSSALGYIPETVWNESCADLNQCGFLSLFATGGGPSSIYAKPPWQAGPGVPNDGHRDLPDLSLSAAGVHDGYLLCQDGVCLTDSKGQLISAFVVGGTSASAPTFAAIMALVLQKTNSRQGQANFVLYPLAAAQTAANCNSSTGPQTQCVFNDITQGNNNVPGQAGASAGPGYDLATGLGTVNAANLVNAWQNVIFRATGTKLQVSPSAITHGQGVTASATVTPASGAGTPSGDVALLTGGSGNLELGPLVNGSVSTTITALPGGSYSLSASYGGDGTFAPSTSAGIPVTVQPEASATTFSTMDGGGVSPSGSTTYSNLFYLQAAVTGASKQGIATGTITFSDTFNGSTTNLMSAPLNSQGNMLVQETSLAVGSHALNAHYSGDVSFLPSSAGPVSVTVSKGITQTILLVPPGALPNTPVILQALVFPEGFAAPTGVVQFYSGQTALGSPVPLQNLFATVTTTQLASGANTITAAYSGDANFNASSSPPSVVFIGNPDFQITVNPGTVAVSSSTPGKAQLLITPGPGLGFTGTVAFSCAGLPAGATCGFSPAQLIQDGFTAGNSTMTISKSGSGGAWPRLLHYRHIRLEWLVALSTVVCLIFLICATKQRRFAMTVASLCVLAAFGVMAGCGGGSNVTSAASTTTLSGNPYVVTVTASGVGGNSTVSHTVTLAVAIQ